MINPNNMLLRTRAPLGALIFLVVARVSFAQDPIAIEKIDRKEPVHFENEILPILRSNCVACHSSSKDRGDVNLESVKAILGSGEDGPILVPGKSAESAILKSAAHQVKPIMPPKKNKVGAKPLSPKELGLLALWIDQGAKSGGSKGATEPIKWHPLPSGHNPIYATAVRFDGEVFACARANQVFLYERDSGKLITRLTDPALLKDGPYKKPGIAHLDSVQCLTFSPDGERLASGGFRCVKVWKHHKGLVLSEFNAGAAPVTCMDVNQAGGVLATGHEDGKVRLQKPSGELIAEVSSGADAVAAISLSMDAKSFCLLGKPGVVSFWTVEGGKETGSISLPSPASSITYIAKDSNLVTGGDDGVVRVWGIPKGPASDGEAKKDGEAAAAAPAPLKELKGHQKKVTCLISIDRDGGQVVSGSEDGSLKLWDAAGGKQVREFKHGSPVRAAAVGKGGTRLASAGDAAGVALWNLADGKEVARLQGDPSLQRVTVRKERHLKLLQDGVAAEKKAREGDTKNLTAKQNALKKNTEALAKAKKALGDKNKALAAVKGDSEKKIQMAEKESKTAETALAAATKVRDEKNKVLAEAKGAGKKVIDQAGKDSQAAAAALAKATKARADRNKALEAARKAADQARIDQADKDAKAAEAALAAATKARDEKKKAFDAAKAESKAKQDQAAKDAKAAADNFAKGKKESDEKKKALAAAQKSVDKKKLEKADKEAKTAQSTVDSAERTLAEAGKDVKKAEGKVKARDEEIKKAEEAVKGPGEAVAKAKAAEVASAKPALKLVFSLDGGQLYTLGENKVMSAWSSETGNGLHSFPLEGRLLAATAEGIVTCREKNSFRRLVPSGRWELEKTLGSAVGESPLVGRILSADFSPDGLRLAAGGGETSRSGELSVWDLEKGELVWRLEDAHSDTIFDVDYSAEGKYLATSGADKFARSFDAADGKRIRFYEGHTAHVLGVSWQSGSSMLATCGADKVIKIWDFKTGEVKRTIAGFAKQVTAISFIGDSQQTLSCSGDKTVRMHTANDGKNIRSLSGGGDYMYSVDASPDATVVVAGGYDSVLHVWNGKDGKSRYQLKPPEK